MSERYVVRAEDGEFLAEFSSRSDKFATDGSTAEHRALSWARSFYPKHQFSVFREDVQVGRDIERILIRRWPGQTIYFEEDI